MAIHTGQCNGFKIKVVLIQCCLLNSPEDSGPMLIYRPGTAWTVVVQASPPGPFPTCLSSHQQGCRSRLAPAPFLSLSTLLGVPGSIHLVVGYLFVIFYEVLFFPTVYPGNLGS